MTDNISLFPQPLPGWTFSVIRAPKFAQRKSRAVSGRTLRALDQLYPVYEWTLTYDVLREKNDTRIIPATIGNFTQLRDLMGHYIAMSGSFGPFLFYDPTDGQVTGQGIAVGNGTTTVFPLIRNFGANNTEFLHAVITGGDAPVVAMTGLGTVNFNVYFDGVLQSSGFSFNSWWANHTAIAHEIVFVSPPGSGVLITADMTYLWPVTFAMDSQEFENFLINRWSVRQLKLESFLLP